MENTNTHCPFCGIKMEECNDSYHCEKRVTALTKEEINNIKLYGNKYGMTININKISNIIPKEITKDSDNNSEYAHFDYYSGIQYAKDNNLKQTTKWNKVKDKISFIVMCGDVVVRINETDYPEIERRII